ncbi:MAG: hypothetical protein P1P88_07060 [Bacteroidales bacterium]|nr:hypothetical protein [Bacteroidales bacterium]
MRLNIRMLIYILSTSLITFSLGNGYISFSYRTKAIIDARSITDAYAAKYANLIKAALDRDFGISRGMAHSMLAIENSKTANKEAIQIEIMKDLLNANPSYIAAFLQWDLSDCKTGYTKTHRRRFIFTVKTG